MPTLSRYLLILFCSLVPAMPTGAEPLLTSLSSLDQAYLEQQQQRIDELAARNLGRRLRGDRTDIELLQGLLDRRVIGATDESGLQALGIVMGNILASEYGLNWVIYSDSMGRSRALHIRAKECLFPSTMIARRARAGIAVDVDAIYRKAVGTVERIRMEGIRSY